MDVDNIAFLESWANELGARASRVRQLIGDAHWLSDGQHKEAIIRDFLKRYVPNRINVSRGFVKGFCYGLDAPCSPEVDILLFDPETHPPWFQEGDLSIVVSSSVFAHLEVKSSFTKANLMAALQTISSVQHVIHSNDMVNDVWRGIVFASIPVSRSANSFCKTVKDSIRAHLRIMNKSASGIDLIRKYGVFACLPNSISSFSRFVAFLSGDENPNSIKLRIFTAEKLSLSCALADLFGAIRCRLGGAVAGELDDLIASLPLPPPINETIELEL